MASLEQSRTKLAGEADLVQKKAFTKWINSHLEKVGVEVMDLFEDLRDGSILLTLLELLTGKKMAREKGKMRVHHIQNVKTAINYLTDVRKIRIVGIPNEEIVDGNRKLTLGLVWMLILNFGLSRALPTDPSQRPKSPKEVSAKEVKKELLEWAQQATVGYEEVSVTNFHKSWNDGLAFCAIINRHRPDLLDYDDCDPNNPLDNFERAFSIAESELGVIRYLDPEDVNVDKPSEEAVLIYVSALKQAFPDMPPPHRRKGPPVSIEDYSTLYSTLEQWIRERRELVSNRSFPSSVDELRTFMEEFMCLRADQDRVREEEKGRLKEMESELKVFAMKRRKDINIPDSSDIDKLWSLAMSESDEYQSLLQSQLNILIKTSEVLVQVRADIDECTKCIEGVESNLEQLNKDSVTMETEEITELITDSTTKLKEIEVILSRIGSGLNTLKELNYNQLPELEEQYSSLVSRVSVLQSSLAQFQCSVGEGEQLLNDADSALKECEKWLIINGKIADNQLIVEQLNKYKMFQCNELSSAGKLMNTVNSTPLIGMEDRVTELNRRWSIIQEQFNNRLSLLESVSDTVSEFDIVKGPLEEWCIQQQELIHSLPLLDTDLSLLTGQREQLQTILSDILHHKESMERMDTLSEQFIKDREPVQASADKFARRLKRLSSEFAVGVVKGAESEDSSMDMSLYEQSEILKDHWERYKSNIELRVQQATDLMNRLGQFNSMHTELRELINEGRSLLNTEKPVGNSAERIEQQTHTCQVFRKRLTDAQSTVDNMLSLGRSIIGEHYTNPHNDHLSQVLTQFIQDWSNLLMEWQNWFDELHATSEQSHSLGEQFETLQHFMSSFNEDMFPAVVAMDTLYTDLLELQDRFHSTVYNPLMSNKALYDTLSSNCHLLPNQQQVEQSLKQFTELSTKVQDQDVELSQVINTVSSWWAEFDSVRSKVNEMREELTETRPLGGSGPVIKEQDEHIQDTLLQVEERRPKVSRVLRNLTSLSNHTSILINTPLIECKDTLHTQWEELHKQVEERRDRVEIGRVRLKVYIECRDPFDLWLKEAESKLTLWKRVDVGDKGVLIEQTESLKAFKTDVELHLHDLQSCTTLGDKFIDTAKAYQTHLLSYKNKLHPPHTLSQLMPDGFYDWEEGEELKGVANFQCTEYTNGILIVKSDLKQLTKCYHKLKGRVSRRSLRYEEAREKRLQVEEALEAIKPKLKGAELLVMNINEGGIGKNSVKSLREQLEMMESLESEFSDLRCLMDPLHLSVASWSVREPLDSEGEGEEGGIDECVKEKECVQERYETVQENVRTLREQLESSLAEAQAFQSAYSSFVSWLRDTERKIQRDNQLKLEINDLKSGLAYLKAVSTDIRSHESVYNDLCGRFHTVIDILKGEEKGETEGKLDNLQTRWAGLQVINEDIEVISDTIPLLESFYTSQRTLLINSEQLYQQLLAYSPSTDNCTGAERKREELEVLSDTYSNLQCQFEALLNDSTSLTDTLFDQRKFESDVKCLRDKLNECKIVRDEKNKTLKHIINKLKLLEVSEGEYVTWLTCTEEKLNTLNTSLSRGNTSEQLKEIQTLQSDVTDHESSLDTLEGLYSSLTVHLEEQHVTHLEDRFKLINIRYHSIHFNTQSFPLEVWLKTRLSELHAMRRGAVLVLPLTAQVNEMNRFQSQVDSALPRINELKGVVSTLPEVGVAKDKMDSIVQEYQLLKQLTQKRVTILISFLPRVKLYEGSLGNWEGLLMGWEESVLALTTPTATPTLINTHIETVKSLISAVSDGEVEFNSLLRESIQLYTGPDKEEEFIYELKGACPSASPLPPDDTRQGQAELQSRLDVDKQRLETVKSSLSSRLSLLSSLLKDVNTFNTLYCTLMPWIEEQLLVAKEQLVIKTPLHKTLSQQLNNCQAIQTLMVQRSPQKEELLQVYQSLLPLINPDHTTSDHTPTNEDHTHSIKALCDTLMSSWSALSDELSVASDSLEKGVKLSRSYERERERLSQWIDTTLQTLTQHDSIPSEPQHVQEMKIKIDSLKSEYNSFAPLLVQCTEEGLRLSQYVQDPTHKEQLVQSINDLQLGWDNVGTLLNDIHTKLTNALMASQQFQQVADNLERWVNATQSTLKSLPPIGARTKLIEAQMEGFKPVVEDIKVNSETLERVKVMGSKVTSDATSEEKLKVEKRLHALETRFYGLEKTAKGRMNELKDAHSKADSYEVHCTTLSNELRVAEERRSLIKATPIRSQPLKSLQQDVKSLSDVLVPSLDPLINEVNERECTLFATQLDTLHYYDNQDDLHLLIDSSAPMGRAESPLKDTPTQLMTTPTHPDFVKRPGAVEAIEIGSKLRNRYEILKSGVNTLSSTVDQLLITVSEYENKLQSFDEWIAVTDSGLNKGTLSNDCEYLKHRLQQLEVIKGEIKERKIELEWINTTGTALIDGCHDDLTRDSVRESLSEVNDKWGDLLGKVDSNLKRYNEALGMAEKYQHRETELEVWLTECESKLTTPTRGLEQTLLELKALENDVNSKVELVHSTVTLGQSLEQCTGEYSTLNYTALKERYDKLCTVMRDRFNETEQSLNNASQLKSQVNSLYDQLLSLKTCLETHEPPRLTPDLIRQQLLALEGTIYSQWNNLQPLINECINKGQQYNDSDITLLIDKLSSTNDAISTLMDSLRLRLEGTLSTVLQYQSEYSELMGWANGVREGMKGEGLPRGTVDGVKIQIEEMEYATSDIVQHQQPLQSLMNIGRGLMGGASPNDCVLVGDELAQVQSSIETLQRQAYSRIRTLKDGLKTAEEFSSYHKSCIDGISSRINDLSSQGPIGTDIDTVKGQLEEFKEFEDELQDIKSRINSCQSKGKHLKGVCHTDDHEWVESKLSELSSLWLHLQSLCVERQQQLDNGLLRLGQFKETLHELLAWINEAIGIINEQYCGVTVETIEGHSKEIQALQSELIARESTVSSLNEAGTKLLSSATAHEDNADIEDNIKTLNTQWSLVKSLSADKHLQLSTAHERARCFHGNWKSVNEMLHQAEESSLQEWVPHGLPESCERDIQQHQETYQSIQSVKESIDELKIEGERLKEQGNELDCQMIDRWISDLIQRWEECMTASEEKQLLLANAKGEAEEFETCFIKLQDELQQLEGRGKGDILSEASAVKRQLEEHNVFLKSVNEFHSQVKDLESKGNSLIKHCISDDGTVIRGKLDELKRCADTVQYDAINHRSLLEEALLSLGEFEEAYVKLKGWLMNINEMTPHVLCGDYQLLNEQLAQHKVFQRELEGRVVNYKSVVKAGKELMKTKQGNDKNILKRKLAELEEEWQGVCLYSTERQQRIEDALRKVQVIQSQIHSLSSWMNKVLLSLQDTEPVHGDVATVHELIETHEAFQRELGAHQKSIDSIEEEGEGLVPHPLDDPSPLKEEIDEIITNWKDICDLSLKKQERLEAAKKSALEFSEGVRELWSWLEERESELEQMDPPADDMDIIQQQTEQLEDFKSIVNNEQSYYDGVIEQGTNLHQLSHPRAEPILEGQLQQLQQKWVGLKSKINARSEALTANKLEIHGLKDMLEQLSAWVQGAEYSMSEAEGVAIGEDLESVEYQLAEHEAFQEDMATLQPNMDALNKAAKRRKPRPSSQPDISKRITHLYKKWQRLWLRSSERHRQLLEARTRLKDIAMARSFNFDAWCKRFVSWVDQQKLRVSDLFRRFDSNHDGMLTREEFMKGLKASGLTMNQIEMEKIADSFDRNKTGLIDLSDIMAILKGQRPKQKFTVSSGPARALSDADKIDMEIQEQVAKCHCVHKFQVVRVGEGQYRFGDSQKLRMVRILRSTVMVRVGGGWEPLPEFLSKNDPCRTTGRTNAELRDLLTTDKSGVTSIEFRRKSQTAINAKNEAALKQSGATVSSRAPHSGRQDNTVTTKRGPVAPRVDTGLRQLRSTKTKPEDKVSPPHSKPLKTILSSPERATPTPATPTRTPSSSKIPLPSGGASKIPIISKTKGRPPR